MGNYNPRVPQILGQEWVPIRDVDFTFAPAVNSQERGHTFTLSTSQTVRTGRYYTHEPLPASSTQFQTMLMNIYPIGNEAASGPIKQVIIPVNSGAITGAQISLAGAISVEDALSVPGDGKSVRAAYDGGNINRLRFTFAVNQYPVLTGKRILGVSMIYSGYATDLLGGSTPIEFVDPNLSTAATYFTLSDGISIGITYGKGPANTGALKLNTGASFNPLFGLSYEELNLGDVNHYWDPAAGLPSSFSVSADAMPWRFQDLQRLEIGATNQLFGWVRFQVPQTDAGTNAQLHLEYAALRVIYCEETRVIYGALRGWHELGANIVTMRNLTHTNDPLLSSGKYTLTASLVNPGDIDQGSGIGPETPLLNAVRQLYEIPSHAGVAIDIPFPLKDHIGDTLTKKLVNILPQLSLHTPSGPITDVHVYGRQVAAQVWGSNVVEQEIADDVVGVDTAYTQVRYYARRFGATENQLSFFNLFAPFSFADLTVTEFDALPELVDGWKEVTKRLSSPTTMGTLVSPQPTWRWATAGVTSGNRWEIMGACAPAISGIPGSALNLAPFAQQLYNATYQPPIGGIPLAWMPQGIGSPYVTSPSADSSSDAVLIFAQDMPAITGFAVTTLSQPITGIGQRCGIDPCCIPSALAYNRLSWNAVLGAGGLSLPNIVGSYASTPDNAALDIVGDIDLRADLTLPTWTIAANEAIVSKFAPAGNQESYMLSLTPGNLVRILWSPDGTGGSLQVRVSTVGVVPTYSGRLAIRATLDVDNGAAGHTVTFYTAPTIAGPWTQLGATVVTAGVTSIFNSTSQMEVGSHSLGTTNIFAGTVHAAQARNGIDGSVVANPNFAAQTPGTTVFTDSAGRVWTVNGTASIVNLDNPLIGNIEIQRSDGLNSTFQTIMRATNSTISSFNDYEARVGIQSSYRIRLVDVLNFPGPWSSTVSATMLSPGVTGGCIGNGHVLIFTTNQRQSGSSNLAYSSVWMDGQVSEDFTFPESDFVQLQLMYDRDFATAFRPLERGGERFSRTVLVQAAAIPPKSLADFKSLRDMAWDTVNYICVRDEGGNRWFATVIVPSGKVVNNRKLYLAPVEIIEVTDTPTPVDP